MIDYLSESVESLTALKAQARGIEEKIMIEAARRFATAQAEYWSGFKYHTISIQDRRRRELMQLKASYKQTLLAYLSVQLFETQDFYTGLEAMRNAVDYSDIRNIGVIMV